MLIQAIFFEKPFRSYAEGTVLLLKDRVTVITGDNGAGKTTLLGLIRAHFDSPWTPSTLAGQQLKDTLLIAPEVPVGEPLSYIDLANDLLSNRGEMVDTHFSLQLSLMHKSSGQAAMLQIVNILRSSKARVHILDEPERGLSPAKQCVLAATLAHIVKARPEDQFLVSTHSPQIMRALGSEVLMLPQGIYLAIDDYLQAADDFGRELAEKYLSQLIEEEASRG